MVMMAFALFLILIGSGFLADRVYQIVSRLKETSNMYTGIIFSLATFVIMITGLFWFKGITSMTMLQESFLLCLQFTRRFALLSMLTGAILGTIVGFIRRFFFWIRR